jgi:cobalt-precorrin 5A hydrolase
MIVAGFGFRASASASSLLDAFAQATGAHRPTHLSAPEDKAGMDCMRAVSEHLQLPVAAVSCGQMSAQETPTQSGKVIETRGVGSVAEAAALAAAGDGATLVEPRSISSDSLATCAIAIGAST